MKGNLCIILNYKLLTDSCNLSISCSKLSSSNSVMKHRLNFSGPSIYAFPAPAFAAALPPHPRSVLTAKPHLTIVAQPQILKPQASVSTQQPGLLHFQELPSLAILRGAQNSTANGSTEVQSHQTGTVELREGCNNVSAANNMHQVAHNEQQQPGAEQ
jgi:hypothetical protein